MTDWLIEVVSVLDGVEEILEDLSGGGRLLSYARDVTRTVAWVRTQPRARVLVLGALGAGFLVGGFLLSSRRQPAATGQPRTSLNLRVSESDPEDDWR